MKNTFSIALLSLAGALGTGAPAMAQVAGGSTTVGVNVVESTQLAMGWSVKKTLIGKAVYNDLGQKIGKVEDLIISPDQNVSFVIVGAGGFVGIGRHDVAIPVSQIQNQAGKLVMAGATKDAIKLLPRFDYANDTALRNQFVAAAEKDIATGKVKMADLEKKASVASADAKTKIDVQITSLRVDLTSADAKLSELKQAAAKRWKEFEAGVSEATARVRKSVHDATA